MPHWNPMTSGLAPPLPSPPLEKTGPSYKRHLYHDPTDLLKQSCDAVSSTGTYGGRAVSEAVSFYPLPGGGVRIAQLGPPLFPHERQTPKAFQCRYLSGGGGAVDGDVVPRYLPALVYAGCWHATSTAEPNEIFNQHDGINPSHRLKYDPGSLHS